MTETPGVLTPDEQKFMAFEGLLGWTAAVATQAQRGNCGARQFPRRNSARVPRIEVEVGRRDDVHAGGLGSGMTCAVGNSIDGAVAPDTFCGK
jgi:hypothetical protein